MKFADLHLHTIFSDGTYTPQGLIERAQKAELSCIAVVDHDTVSGITPVLESSASSDGLEIHILGYLFDYQNRELVEKIDILKQIRIERIYKMVDKLKGLGIKLNPETVFDLAPLGTVGRLHVARAMVKEGLVGSTGEAFARYIGDKCPAYVLGFRLSPQEAIGLIKRSGGIPVLAHPYTVGQSDLLYKIIDCGIMGLEVYYPEHLPQTVNFYLGVAKKYELLVTGGSDCHGAAKPNIKIGTLKIPYELVEKLKAAKEKII